MFDRGSWTWWFGDFGRRKSRLPLALPFSWHKVTCFDLLLTFFRPAESTPLRQSKMPRATSGRFSRTHQPSIKSAAASSSSKNHSANEGTSAGVRNPIFNTERFGQHILKNPQIAQTYAQNSHIIYFGLILHQYRG